MGTSSRRAAALKAIKHLTGPHGLASQTLQPSFSTPAPARWIHRKEQDEELGDTIAQMDPGTGASGLALMRAVG